MEDRVINLEKQMAGQQVLLSRVDAALDKISEVSLNVSKLLAVHEQRIESQEEASRKLDDKTDELHSRVSSSEQRLRNEMAEGQKEILMEIKNLRTDMSEDITEMTHSIREDVAAKLDGISSRVTKLERLSWLVIGGATVIGFIIAQLIGLFSGYFNHG